MCGRTIERVDMDASSTLRIILSRCQWTAEYDGLTKQPAIKLYRTGYIRAI